MLHLALAGAFFVLALLHFATWAAVRSQRVQLWLAMSFLGFAVLAMTTGLTSNEASVMVADTRPWLFVSALTAIILPFSLLRVVWSLLDVPLTLWRRALLAVALVLGVVRLADVSWSLLQLPSTGVSAEAFARAAGGLSLPLFWALATCVAATWTVEAVRLLRRRGAMAVAVLVASLCGLALLSRELAVDAGWVPGPPVFALVGVPFLMLASTALAILTARSLRGAVGVAPQPAGAAERRDARALRDARAGQHHDAAIGGEGHCIRPPRRVGPQPSCTRSSVMGSV